MFEIMSKIFPPRNKNRLVWPIFFLLGFFVSLDKNCKKSRFQNKMENEILKISEWIILTKIVGNHYSKSHSKNIDGWQSILSDILFCICCCLFVSVLPEYHYLFIFGRLKKQTLIPFTINSVTE